MDLRTKIFEASKIFEALLQHWSDCLLLIIKHFSRFGNWIFDLKDCYNKLGWKGNTINIILLTLGVYPNIPNHWECWSDSKEAKSTWKQSQHWQGDTGSSVLLPLPVDFRLTSEMTRREVGTICSKYWRGQRPRHSKEEGTEPENNFVSTIQCQWEENWFQLINHRS